MLTSFPCLGSVTSLPASSLNSIFISDPAHHRSYFIWKLSQNTSIVYKQFNLPSSSFNITSSDQPKKTCVTTLILPGSGGTITLNNSSNIYEEYIAVVFIYLLNTIVLLNWEHTLQHTFTVTVTVTHKLLSPDNMLWNVPVHTHEGIWLCLSWIPAMLFLIVLQPDRSERTVCL